jgi:SAM-dependent methyltransferase
MTGTLIVLIINLLFLIFLNILMVFMLHELYKVHRGDVPFVPSTKDVLRTIAEGNIMPKSGTIIDLGCGNGKALVSFRKNGCSGPLLGYEYALFPYILARIRTRNMKGIRIVHKRFEHAPVEDADAIYCFLYPEVMEEIAETLFRRARPGTLIVSAEFAIKQWEPERILHARGVTNKHAPIYVYRVPHVTT